MNKNCFKCKCGETEDNPLMPDSYYEDIYLCHDCWFSEDIQKWRNEKEKTDPLYKRYSDLTTAGFKISCPSCGKETNRSPKFIGHSPTWEVCCTKCSETDYNTVSPYKYDLSKWHVLYESFMKVSWI